MDTITEQLSDYVVGLSYEDLDPLTTEQTKIRFIDSLACAVAAFDEVTSIGV